MNSKVIAIDGPAGSGKSTMAKELAQELGFHYLDTGAFYRTLTLYLWEKWKAVGEGDFSDWVATQTSPDVLAAVSIECKLEKGKTNTLFLNGENVNSEIRNPEVTALIRYVANRREFRDFINTRLRKIAEGNSLVIDGRDIGTEVFPDAKFKFFLTAPPRVRAERRALELEAAGTPVDLDQMERDIVERDRSDMERDIAPLKQADDAFLIDTGGLSKDIVIRRLLDKVR